MPERSRHVLSHAAIYLIARGVPGLIAFWAIPVFTRLLRPEEYARYALVIGTVAMLNALLFQWMRLALVRYLPAFKDDSTKLKSTLVSAGLLLAIVLAIVPVICFAVPALRAWGSIASACWIMLAIQAIFELCCEYARAVIRPWHYMILQLARSIATLGLGVGLVKAGLGWWGPLLGMTAGMGLGAIYAWLADWRDVRFFIDRATLVKVCQYGIPLSLTVALAIVIGVSDRFLIVYFINEAAAGIYSAAVDFTSQTLTLLMMVIYLAMFPMAVRAFENHGKEAAQEQMRSNASLLLAVGVPCVVGMSILAPGIAHCFLGKSFGQAAATIMPLIALGSFLAGMKAYHFDSAFQFSHRTIYQVWIVLFVAIVNIALNLFMIPLMGINGAAIASAGAYLLSIALTVGLGRRHFELPFPVSNSIRVLIAAAAMAIVIFPMRDRVSIVAVVAEVAAGMLVYAAALVAMNFLGLRSALARRYNPSCPEASVQAPSLAMAEAP